MSMTAQEEHDARTEAEETHAELLLLLLLGQSKDIASSIAKSLPFSVDTNSLYELLRDAGLSGAEIIKVNSSRLPEIVQSIIDTGFVQQEAHVAANQMTSTTVKHVNEVLGEFDLSADEKSRLIKTTLDNLANSRSTTAAGNMVVFAAESLKDKLVGLQGTKTWRNMRDNRVRPTHIAAGGQKVKVKELFSVGSSLLRYPRDPFGSARETMGCRCVAEYSEDW